MVLNTALSGKADYIVTGDTHLLNLRELRGIRIVTVKRSFNCCVPVVLDG
jgi:predicted nucleic acid-binding protein